MMMVLMTMPGVALCRFRSSVSQRSPVRERDYRKYHQHWDKSNYRPK
jgi:hypothetical protein